MPIANTNRYEDIAGTGITVITTRLGDTFLIDTEKREIAERHCWSRHEHGYARAVARAGTKMKTVYLHRLVCKTSAESPHVDHINGDTSDCRSINLRSCDRKQNLRNQKRRSDNSSGFKGVGLHKQTKMFRARVRVDGKALHLGLFKSAEEAGAAAAAQREMSHGEFARHE